MNFVSDPASLRNSYYRGTYIVPRNSSCRIHDIWGNVDFYRSVANATREPPTAHAISQSLYVSLAVTTMMKNTVTLKGKTMCCRLNSRPSRIMSLGNLSSSSSGECHVSSCPNISLCRHLESRDLSLSFPRTYRWLSITCSRLSKSNGAAE